MISYTVQAVLALLLGPILMIPVLAFDANFPESIYPKTTMHWLTTIGFKLAASIHQANIFLAVSVMIATIIRLQKVAPLAEVRFLTHLTIFEFGVAMVSGYSSLPMHTTISGYPLAPYLYMAVSWVFFFAILTMRSFPSSQSHALEAITLFCFMERDYPIPAVEFETPVDASLVGFVFLGTTAAFLLVCALFLLMYIRFAPHILKLYRFFRDWNFEFCNFIHITPSQSVVLAYVISSACVWVGGVLVTWRVMEYERRSLQRATGAAYQDNQWGFGQIMALMVWAPFVQELIYSILGMP